jgi:uncharacterized repeat protein (TIGR02543 family)
MLVAPVSGGSELVEAAAGTANPSILTYTATNSVASVSLVVASPGGTFATSTEEQKAAFSIVTNNATGYTLSAKMTGSAGFDLYNMNDSNVSIANLPSSVSSGITASEFDTATYNNMWGYLPSMIRSGNINLDNNKYFPASVAAKTLAVTGGASGDADEYTIGLGIRADYTKSSSVYASYAFRIEVVANPIAYTIGFADDTGDSSVASLPSSLSSTTSNTSVTLTNNKTPTRTGYTFAGKWCLGSTRHDGVDCDGTEYNVGGSFGIDQTITPNTATLYAMWTKNTYMLAIDNFDILMQTRLSSIKVCTVAGNCSGSDLKGTVTNGSSTVSGLAYGETYYLFPVFSSGASWFGGWSSSQISFSPSASVVNPSFVVGDSNMTVSILTNSSCTSAMTLYNNVACQSKGVQTASGLQTAITLNNSGVYKYDTRAFGTTNESGDIYYYRGILDVTTGSYGSDGDGKVYPNYVKIADTCWRIVRTVGGSRVRMIYNGAYSATTGCANSGTSAQISSGAFGLKGNSNQTSTNWGKNINRVGWTFNNTASLQDSTTATAVGTVFSSTVGTANSNIKNVVDTWYSSFAGDVTRIYSDQIILASSSYCNDRSAYSNTTTSTSLSTIKPYATSSATMYFGAYGRNYNAAKTPRLYCSQSGDIYSADVALLTADESSFAGSGSTAASYGSTYNANSFLRTGNTFWLLSPASRLSSGTGRMFVLSSGGSLDFGIVSADLGIRPVITLASGVYVTSGSGSAADPWEIAGPAG